MNIRACLLGFSLMVFAIARANNTDTRSDSIDILNTSLLIDVSNFSSRILHGEADITFTAKVDNVRYIKLDLLELVVDSVRSSTGRLRYAYNGSMISVNLPAPLGKGKSQSISIYYHGSPIQIPGDFGGFYWDDQYAFNIGVSFLSVPHNFGKVWFPCFDNFIERSTFHFVVTTDPKRLAMCNGRLDSVTTRPNGNKKWYWTMPDPIPSYLASIAVSDYVVLKDSFNSLKGTLPIMLAARAKDTANLEKSFIHLKDALSIFENRFGPYEFDKVGYSIVPFTAGAMEHATNIAYMEGLVNGDITNEYIMAHELAHHWFGDLVTVDDESEMWLQEGWAAYCEDLFYEGLYGEDLYKQVRRTKHENVVRMAHIVDSAYWAPSGIPPNLTYSSYSVYEQGADRVHTLRSYMGDSLFFGCVRSYLREYKFKPVNSAILRDYLSSCSGLSNIKDFFTDWIFSEGFPDFSIEQTRIVSARGNYGVTIAIRQRSDHTTHLFNNVPVEVAYFDSLGNKTVMVSYVSGECTQFFTSLPFSPVYISLDFDDKISGAVTDDWVRMTGINRDYDLGVAKMKVHLIRSTDSSLVRVEHHFVAPDAAMNSIPGLHLSDYRYWDVDGIWSPDFEASATIKYNGSTYPQGYLDNTLITNVEDSLVLMYRPDAASVWRIDEGAVLNTEGNIIDKVGSFTIRRLRKGQYALAIYDAGRVDQPSTGSPCPLLTADNPGTAGSSFRTYANPTHQDELNIEIEGKNEYEKCVMVNAKGDTVMDKPLKEGQDIFIIYMNGLPRGTYMISLVDKNNNSISQTIQKSN